MWAKFEPPPGNLNRFGGPKSVAGLTVSACSGFDFEGTGDELLFCSAVSGPVMVDMFSRTGVFGQMQPGMGMWAGGKL